MQKCIPQRLTASQTPGPLRSLTSKIRAGSELRFFVEPVRRIFSRFCVFLRLFPRLKITQVIANQPQTTATNWRSPRPVNSGQSRTGGGQVAVNPGQPRSKVYIAQKKLRKTGQSA